MTTRKYPRTLNEAFPFGSQYAGSIYTPRSEVGIIVGLALVIIRIIIGLALYGICFAAMLMLVMSYFDVLVK